MVSRDSGAGWGDFDRKKQLEGLVESFAQSVCPLSAIRFACEIGVQLMFPVCLINGRDCLFLLLKKMNLMVKIVTIMVAIIFVFSPIRLWFPLRRREDLKSGSQSSRFIDHMSDSGQPFWLFAIWNAKLLQNLFDLNIHLFPNFPILNHVSLPGSHETRQAPWPRRAEPAAAEPGAHARPLATYAKRFRRSVGPAPAGDRPWHATAGGCAPLDVPWPQKALRLGSASGVYQRGDVELLWIGVFVFASYNWMAW